MVSSTGSRRLLQESDPLSELQGAVENWQREVQLLRDGLKIVGSRVEALRSSQGKTYDMESSDIQLILKEIQLVQRDVSVVKDENLPRIERLVEKLNGSVRRNTDVLAAHETKITVLERVYNDQVAPALKQIVDNRVDIAVTVAKIAAGGLGAGGGIAFVVGKALGWF